MHFAVSQKKAGPTLIYLFFVYALVHMQIRVYAVAQDHILAHINYPLQKGEKKKNIANCI